MAGTLYGLGLSQQVDAEGAPLSGAKLYVYQTATTTLVNVYTDQALTTIQANPMIADANGRIPPFWLANGTYRARLLDADDVVVFDYSGVTALGPAETISTSVDTAALLQTGDVVWRPQSGTRTGWVRLNGRTIGSASSGSTERANADTSALYTYLWENFSNSICAVSTGRGATAAADFAANKTIALIDLRGRSIVGLDDMGNTAAARLDASVVGSGLVTDAANTGGASTVTLTSAQMPSHTHVATATAVADHQHFIADNTTTETADLSSNVNNVPITNSATGGYTLRTRTSGNTANAGLTSAAGGHTPAVTNANTGGGTAHTNMQPFMLGTYYIKL